MIPNSKGNKAVPMPFHYIIEMLLDWKAMSYKFGDDILDFYHKNKHKMILHKDTIVGIENWIEYIGEIKQD